MDAFINKIISEIDLESKQYYVRSGDQVLMSDGEKYTVAHILLQEELRKQLDEGKVWGLLCLVNPKSGNIYSHPLPVMSVGTVDIRELMGIGRHPIGSVTFVKEENGTRFYKVNDKSGYVHSIEISR